MTTILKVLGLLFKGNLGCLFLFINYFLFKFDYYFLVFIFEYLEA